MQRLLKTLEDKVGNGMGRMPLRQLIKLLSSREEACPRIYKALAQFVDEAGAHLDEEINTLTTDLVKLIAGEHFIASQLYLLGSAELRYVSIEHLEVETDGSKLNTILLESIRRKGIQQPIRCLIGNGKLKLKVVEGNNRVLVCRILGLEKIPAYVFPPTTTWNEFLEVRNAK